MKRQSRFIAFRSFLSSAFLIKLVWFKIISLTVIITQTISRCWSTQNWSEIFLYALSYLWGGSWVTRDTFTKDNDTTLFTRLFELFWSIRGETVTLAFPKIWLKFHIKQTFIWVTDYAYKFFTFVTSSVSVKN